MIKRGQVELINQVCFSRNGVAQRRPEQLVGWARCKLPLPSTQQCHIQKPSLDINQPKVVCSGKECLL